MREQLAPLLRFVPHVKPAEEFFVSKMERECDCGGWIVDFGMNVY